MILRVKNLGDIVQGTLIDEPKRKKSKKSEAEDEFAFQATAHRLPAFARNFRFAKAILHEETGKPRQWALDFAWPEYRVALEIEGLVFRKIGGELVATGRHVHPDGFREDCIKYAHAQILGWSLLRFDPQQVTKGIAIRYVMDLLAAKGWTGVTGEG